MRFRYLVKEVEGNKELNAAVITFCNAEIEVEGRCGFNAERIASKDTWMIALENLAIELAKQLKAARDDADQLGDALNQVLKMKDEK